MARESNYEPNPIHEAERQEYRNAVEQMTELERAYFEENR